MEKKENIHREGRGTGDGEKGIPIYRKKWFIVLFFVVLLSLTAYFRYIPYQGKITHSYPMTINAADPNSRLSEAEWVEESQIYDLMPPWFAEEKNIAQHYAPALLILPAALSQMVGIEVYDTIFLIGVLISFGIAACIFVLFRQYVKNDLAAFVGAAIVIFPYESFYHYQLNIGMYGNYFTGLFYPLALIFLYQYIDDRSIGSIIGLALMVAFQYYVHATEAIVFLGFIGAYILVSQWKETETKTLLTHLLVLGGVFLLLIIPHLPLLYSSWFVSGHGRVDVTLFKPYPSPAHEPQFGLLNLLHPLLWVFFIIGAVVLMRKKKYLPLLAFAGIYVFVTFILAYLGIGTYYITIRARYLLYVLLYPIAAMGIAAAINLVERIPAVRNAVRRDFILAAVLAAIFLSTNTVAQRQGQGGGLITQEMYDGFLWLRQNSDPDSSVLCFGCYQFESLNTHRKSLNIAWEYENSLDIVLGLAQNTSDSTTIGLDYIGYRDNSPVRKNFFVYEVGKMQGQVKRDLCNADYFMIRPYGELTNAFLAIAQRMLAKNTTIAYQNPHILILRNGNVGEACV